MIFMPLSCQKKSPNGQKTLGRIVNKQAAIYDC